MGILPLVSCLKCFKIFIILVRCPGNISSEVNTSPPNIMKLTLCIFAKDNISWKAFIKSLDRWLL